jgi:hypothetical protein
MAGPVTAQQGPVVVELFTSQGCSSCPPADALIADLAHRRDVLPLSLHVDYWDYIGWKDDFALADHGRRQKGYAHAAGRDMVYTPQMVVGGQQALAGSHPMKLAELIDLHRAAPQQVRLGVERSGQAVVVTVAPAVAIEGDFVLHLVRYDAMHHVDIGRGENAGRSMDYANVVTGWSEVGRWDGQGPGVFDLTLQGDGPAALLLQRLDFGPILAAARID